MPISVNYPYTFANGTTIDAGQVNANFAAINTLGFANAAQSGANSDITSISGLTTPLSVAQGGTASTTGAGLAVPTGTVMAFAGAAAPSGWIGCGGQAISRTTFAALFAVIGTSWGAGDGNTTFNVPDFRGRTLAGYDAGNATGRLTGAYAGGANAGTPYSAGGEQAHTLTQTELVSHNHNVGDPGHNHTSPAHGHALTDPGHAHTPSSLYDPGHTHQVNDPTHGHADAGHSHNSYGSNQPPGVGGILQNSTGASTDAQHSSEVGYAGIQNSGTGIYLNAAATGVQNNSNTGVSQSGLVVNTTAVGVNTAGTGVVVLPTGGSAAHNTVQPTAIVVWIIKD